MICKMIIPLIVYVFLRGYSKTKESLIVIKDIGIQIQEKKLNGKVKKYFID